MAEVAYTPYSTIRPFIKTLPSWVSGVDQERIASYEVYEQLYWSVPQAFKLSQRGTDSNPIYVPSGRTIVEACNRFLAKDFGIAVNPLGGSEQQQGQARAYMRKLFARERFRSKFNNMKRSWLIKGDALWHIVADPAKPDMSRISMYDLDPASYFPITDENDINKVIGCHIIESVMFEGKPAVQRQTYRKVQLNLGKPATITTELSVFEAGKWDDRFGGETKLLKALNPEHALDPKITALPVYHMRNQGTSNNPFGSSEMRGIERVMSAVNQGISDEELALAMEGLGVYATTSGPPVDEDGNETDWVLGPGRVVEHAPDSDFQRVSGVDAGAIAGMQEHLRYLGESMRDASGTPPVAIGNVDVQVAESGIALQLRMGPILSKNAEKEDEIMEVHDQMFYDLINGWIPAYEKMNLSGVETSPIVGPPLPVDRAGTLAEIVTAFKEGLISGAYARQMMVEKLGYEFPDEMGADIIMETAARTEAIMGESFRARLEEEMGVEVPRTTAPPVTAGATGAGPAASPNGAVTAIGL